MKFKNWEGNKKNKLLWEFYNLEIPRKYLTCGFFFFFSSLIQRESFQLYMNFNQTFIAVVFLK